MRKLWLLLICCYHYAYAIENFSLTFAHMEGNGWQAQNIQLQLNQLTETDFSSHILIAQLQLPFIKTAFKQFIIDCPQTYYSAEKILCVAGQFHLSHEILSDLSGHLTFSYDLLQQQLQLTLTQVDFADGQLDLSLQMGKNFWQGDMDLRQINLSKINELFPQSLTITGNADLDITITQGDEKQQIDVVATVTEGNFANADFTQATENLLFNINLQAIHSNEQWQLQSDLMIQQGGIYSEPIYTTFDDQVAKLAVLLTWQENRLIIQQLTYQHGEAIDLTAKGIFNLIPLFAIEDLSIQATFPRLQDFRDTYLASWLETKSFNNLILEGNATVNLDWTASGIHCLTTLHQVNLTDSSLKIGLLDLNGRLQWHDQLPLPSHLSWSSGYVAKGVSLGAGQLAVQFFGDQITLLSPLHLPILEGALQIETFDLTHFFQPEKMQWTFKGRVLPISLAEIMAAFHLPEIEGQFALILPNISYKNQMIVIDKPIVIKLFDGQIMVKQLTVKKPFSRLATLNAEISLNQLNLAKLTHITKFGEIQGGLSGFINQLTMINWQPITFNAYFATPKNSVLPRTISQKAIDNLTNLGGGGTVDTLSRAALSVFKEFSYQELGWGCELKNAVCYMHGVDSKEEGYYIIKGGGLPRIDIIGYNREVDWQTLLTRLKRVMHLQSPVIE